MQAHPALQIAVKVLFGAIAITGVYQSQLYAFWLQYLGATIAAVLVGAYGFSRSSLSSSGQSFCYFCHEQLCCMLMTTLPPFLQCQSCMLSAPLTHSGTAVSHLTTHFNSCADCLPLLQRLCTEWYSVQFVWLEQLLFLTVSSLLLVCIAFDLELLCV